MMMLPFKSVLALVVLATSSYTATADEICVEGYLMDKFCIDQGFLFQDKKDVKSLFPLSHPDVHMLKCLVGMPFCRASGYEILLDPLEMGDDYCRGFDFDAPGDEKIIMHAKAFGKWDMDGTSFNETCGNFCAGNGTTVKGMRASIRGTITASSTPTLTPPTLTVTSVSAEGNCTASEKSMMHALTDHNGNCTTAVGSGTSTTAVGFGMIVLFVIVQSLMQF